MGRYSQDGLDIAVERGSPSCRAPASHYSLQARHVAIYATRLHLSFWELMGIEGHLGTLGCWCAVGSARAPLADRPVGFASDPGRAAPHGAVLAVLPHVYAAPVQHLQVAYIDAPVA